MISRIYNYKKYIQSGYSLLILGPRGSGKSLYFRDLLNSLNVDYLLIDLLSQREYLRYLSQPSLLQMEVIAKLKQRSQSEIKGRLIVFIDEIQLIPELTSEVHKLIQDYQNQLVFILTGSSARKLKRKNANLLAGRALSFPFLPLTQEEIAFEPVLDMLVQFGTLPACYLEKDTELKQLYLSSYTNTYLQQEISQEAAVRNLPTFNRFLELAAQQNSAIVNYSKLARVLGIAPNTVRGYYQILEDTLLITRVPAWTHSVKKQLIAGDKIFFFDNGVLNTLLGQLRMDISRSSTIFGMLFENLIVNEIIRYNFIHNLNHSLYHYRTNHGQEIDLIVQQNFAADPIAIEIKSSSNPDISKLKELLSFREENPQSKLLVICTTPRRYEEKGILFLPFTEAFSEIFAAHLSSNTDPIA